MKNRRFVDALSTGLSTIFETSPGILVGVSALRRNGKESDP